MLVLAGVEKMTLRTKLRNLYNRRIRNPYVRFLWLILALSGRFYSLRDEYLE